MYKYIYFDLDGTLIKDNVITGRAETLEDGLEKYKELCNMYPDSRKILFTNRDRDQIKYPSIYTFDEIGLEQLHLAFA